MVELFGSDLRPSLPRITSPALVLGTWAGLRDQTAQTPTPIGKDAVVENFRRQYQGLSRLHFALSESARHFVMFDDPAWFYEQVDAFLASPAETTVERGFTR
jgi:pimeloyl-ACP methyl ester carboxylesterase